MASVFISYRRTDSSVIVGRIHDRLLQYFESEDIFRDLDSIEPGQRFSSRIEETLKIARVALVIIGPEWITVTNQEGQLRLEHPEDLVRLEVEAALQGELLVIPVLVSGAMMPSRTELPSVLHPLTDIHAAVVRDDPDFHKDMDALMETILRETSGYSRGTGIRVQSPIEKALRDYADGVVSSYEANPHTSLFVDPPVSSLQTSGVETLSQHLCASHGTRGAYLLGEFGAGKSSLLRKVEYSLTRQWLQDRLSPFPIWVNLQTYVNAQFRFEDILADGLRRVFGPDLPRDQSPVFLLDGLDEMAAGERLAAFAPLIGQFDEASAAANHPPFVIGSRLTFYREVSRLYAADERTRLKKIELAPWGELQIREYLANAEMSGVINESQCKKAEALLNQFSSVEKLCSKPLVCHMLVNIWAAQPDFAPKHSYEVFSRYIDLGVHEWTSRVANVSSEDRQVLNSFVDRLVLSHMVRQNSIVSVTAADLQRGLRKMIKRDQVADSLEASIRQLKTRSLLSMVGDEYEMFHRQMAEYIIARSIRGVVRAPANQRNHARYTKLAELMRRNPLLYSSVSENFVIPMAIDEGWDHELEEWLLSKAD